VPREFFDLFGSRVKTFTPARVLLPPTPADAARHELVVRPQDLDPMGHVNNAAYVDFLEESLIADGRSAWLERRPRRYRLEYVAAAESGETLTGALWPLGGDVLGFRLTGPSGAEVLRAALDVSAGPERAGRVEDQAAFSRKCPSAP